MNNAFVVSYTERLVEGLKNSGTFTGFIAKVDKEKNQIHLMMSNNEALNIPINVKKVSDFKVHSPLTCECHIFGGRNKEGKPYTEIRAFRTERPSTLALPNIAVWYGIKASASVDEAKAELAKHNITESTDKIEETGKISETLSKKETEFRPFLSSGKLRGFLKNETDETNIPKDESTEETNLRIIGELQDASGFKPNTNNGGYNNVVRLIGIVDSIVVVPATEHRRAHGIVFLRQHEDASKSIPLWIVGDNFKAHLKTLFVGSPISILGQARYKVYPNDNGELVDGGLHIRCWKFYSVDLKKDIPFTPKWWIGMKDRIIKDRQDKMSALQAAQMIKEKTKLQGVAVTSNDEKVFK